MTTMGIQKTTKMRFEAPRYSMKDIYAAIPPYCFRPNTLVSLGYVLRDLTLVFTLGILASHVTDVESFCARTIVWTIYAFCQGLVFTGLWEIAHECGHGALSQYIPYHSWRFTHQAHHKGTNNLERDIAFVPNTKEERLAAQANSFPLTLSFRELLEDMPIVALVTLVVHQLVAFPIYLLFNNFALERIRRAAWWKRSHFYFGADGPNFKPLHFKSIVISDLGIAIFVSILWLMANKFGTWTLILYYGFPYLWTNHWILTITYLQHTDPRLPYYGNSGFTFVRGAAAAIDRDFGLIGKHLFHGAINTHVLHHHCCKIPFYYAEEATDALRKAMGDSYICDFESNYLGALWRNYRTCKYIESSTDRDGVFFFSLERLVKSE